MAEEDGENPKPRKKKVKSKAGKDEAGSIADISSSSAKMKLDQLLQQVVAQSTKDASESRKKKKKTARNQENEGVLESLWKGDSIEGLHKERDDTVLANTYDPDDNMKSEKGNKQRQRRQDKNKNAGAEEGKQNNDTIEPAGEKKKKKAKKKRDESSENKVEQEVQLISEQQIGEQPEKRAKTPRKKVRSPDPEISESLQPKIEKATPAVTPRKKKANQKNDENKGEQQEPQEASEMKPKQKKKRATKAEVEEERVVSEKEEVVTVSPQVKTKKKKKKQENEERDIKDEKAEEQGKAAATETSPQKSIKSKSEKDETKGKATEEQEEEGAEVVKPKPRKKKKAVSGDDKTEGEDENLKHESVGEVTTTPRRKQKKKTKSAGDENVQAAESGAVQTPQEVEDLGEVLALIIHRTDKLKNDFHILHPVVRVHVVSEETGQYVPKQHLDRAVTSYFETSNEAVKTILPMMTHAFDFKKRKSTIPVWEDLLVFNENFNYLVQPESKVLLLFELLDFVSMNTASHQFSTQKEEGGWHRIAWAFLKVLGKNGKVNAGTKMRLQLFTPPNKVQQQIPGQPQVYQWWKSAQRTLYPSTLYVTLKNMQHPGEVSGALRSMFATQKELGEMSYKDLKSMSWSGRDKSQTQGRTVTSWTRLLGQLCRVPNSLTLTLAAGRKGCFVVKFSNDGRSIACACQDGSDHPILVYEIPSGTLRGQFQGHFGIVYSLSWSKRDTFLLSASNDGTARVWDTQKFGESQSRLLPHPGFVYTAEFHPRVDSIIASGCYDEVVRIWDTSVSEDSSVLQQEMEEHHGHINSICFDIDDGQKMYTADSVGTIIIWNCYVSDQPSRKHFLRDWTKYLEIKDPELINTPINFITMHPSGRRLLVHSRNNAVFMFDLRVQRVTQKYFGAENLKEKICSTVTPCGSFVFSGSEDGKLYAWNTDTGDQVAVYTQLNYQTPVTDVDYHPRDHMLALCSLGDSHPVYVYRYDPHIAQTDAATTRPISPLESTDIEEMGTARTSTMMDTTRTKVMSKEEFETLAKVRYQRVVKKLETATLQMNQMPGMVVPEALYSPRMDTIGCSGIQSSWKLPIDAEYTLTPRSSGVSPGLLSPHAPPGSAAQLSGQISSYKRYIGAADGDWRPGFSEVGRSGTRSHSPTFYGRPPHLSLSASLGKPQFTFESPTGKSADYKQVIAIYDYRAQRSDELTLYKGDVITVLYKDNESWWMGELSDGQQGFFPSNYVTDDDDQRQYKSSKTSSVGSSGTVTAVRTKAGELKFLSGGEESDVETPRSRKKQVTINSNRRRGSKSSLPPSGPLKELNNSINALLDTQESVA